jgi:tyrosyl-tRNA synthetase
MLQDATEGADGAFSGEPRTAYVGFDPTASSLHVGSLLPIMVLVHLQRAGHTPIALVGGGTGLIGDPSGKTEERKLLSTEQAEENARGIRAQLEHFLDFEAPSNPAIVENNLEWLGSMRLIDFLRDTGKHFSVNAMLKKESVRRRIETDEAGITYTEFSYALLQAYDFLALYDRHRCTVQLGGSDQWGNITAGIELIRRMRGTKAFGVVFPLVTGTAGVKFGKTEAGTVWLDERRTSPYRFYQFWMNTSDEDVIRYLKYFSLKGPKEIRALEEEVKAEPHKRAAHKALAEEVTGRLHGQTGLQRARQATEVLFGGDMRGLEADVIADIFADVPSSGLTAGEFEGEGKDLLDLLVETGLATSRGDARRSIAGGGVYVNNLRVGDPETFVRIQHAVEGRFLILRKGKKRYHLVRIER